MLRTINEAVTVTLSSSITLARNAPVLLTVTLYTFIWVPGVNDWLVAPAKFKVPVPAAAASIVPPVLLKAPFNVRVFAPNVNVP